MKLKKTLAAILALVMAVAMLPLSGMQAKAESASEEFDVSGSKTASPTELDWKHRETTVTLSLPSAEYKNVYDIVFVMDSSSSTKNNDIDFSSYVIDLLDAFKDKNATFNVGVIKVRGLAFDTINLTDKSLSGMVKYSEDTKQTITDAINFKEADLKALSSGTNMHAGLDMANDWLTADTDVPDNQKYVFMLTDGKTYIWNDENDIPTTVYGQYMAKNTVTPIPTVGQQTIAYSKSAYKFIDNVNFFSATAEELASLSFDEYFEKTGNFYTDDFAKLYASSNTELSQPTKYDYRCGYAYKEPNTASGTVSEHALTNSHYTYKLHNAYYEFTPDDSFADLNWLQANPYTVEETDGQYSYTETVNPDFYQLHPDSLQKALYLTGHLWTEMVGKYNGAAIIYDGWGGGSGLEIARSFNSWIKGKGISDFAADISNADSVAAIFNSVKEDILYMVNSGFVTDVIDSNFTLKNSDNANAFRMTLEGKELAVTYADSKWSFGEPSSEGKYDYEVTLESSNTFKWTINVPIENLRPVTLSYDLQISEKATTDFYNTNESAVLDYTSTDGKRDGTYTFEVPKVSYIAPTEIKVEKVWEDAENQDGIRPDKVLVTVLADGEPYIEANVTAADQWAYTFKELPEAKLVEENSERKLVPIEYTIEELEVEGYVGEVTSEREATEETAGEASAPAEETAETETTEAEAEKKGTLKYTITNTHTPETIEITGTKTWDDANDVDGIRPKSITINLLADGTKVKSLEVKETDGKFTWTFTEMPKYKDGKEIVYTITEDAVEGYTATVDGFNVTNKHVPVNPPTGDPNQIPVLAIAGVSALLTMIILIIIQAMRRKAEN